MRPKVSWRACAGSRTCSSRPATSLVTQSPCWRARRSPGSGLHDPRVDVPKVAMAMSQMTWPSPHARPCVLKGSLSCTQAHAWSSIPHRALSYTSPAHSCHPAPHSALAMRSSSILGEEYASATSGQAASIVRQRTLPINMIGGRSDVTLSVHNSTHIVFVFPLFL